VDNSWSSGGLISLLGRLVFSEFYKDLLSVPQGTPDGGTAKLFDKLTVKPNQLLLEIYFQ
jgi:hypothetical protein